MNNCYRVSAYSYIMYSVQYYVILVIHNIIISILIISIVAEHGVEVDIAGMMRALFY